MPYQVETEESENSTRKKDVSILCTVKERGSSSGTKAVLV